MAACSSSKDEGKTNEPATGGDSGTCDDNAVASAAKPCSKDPDPCHLNSGFKGDEYCIPPPPPGKGIQIHFGPSNYTDAAEVAKYTLQPGDEFNSYGIAKVSLPEDHWYNFTQIRMRPGSHHLINTLVQGQNLPEGFAPDGQPCPGTAVSSFPGTQNLIRNMPPGGKEAPENVGLGSKFAANTDLCLNYHTYNFTQEVQLREVWINVWFVDESEVTQKAQGIFVIAGPWAGIPPHSQQVLTASATINGDGRIISMFGHRHAWTDRFAVWKNDELVYDSWHWQESVVFDYDSITQNPPPNPPAKTDGATSGELPVTTGDKIKIECDIDNQSDNTLTFQNKLYEGEMCILFGASVGTPVGGIPAGFNATNAN
jgi:hypothetical protein